MVVNNSSLPLGDFGSVFSTVNKAISKATAIVAVPKQAAAAQGSAQKMAQAQIAKAQVMVQAQVAKQLAPIIAPFAPSITPAQAAPPSMISSISSAASGGNMAAIGAGMVALFVLKKKFLK